MGSAVAAGSGAPHLDFRFRTGAADVSSAAVSSLGLVEIGADVEDGAASGSTTVAGDSASSGVVDEGGPVS